MLKIEERPGAVKPWVIVDDETGAVVGSSDTREKAERAMGYRIAAWERKQAEKAQE